MRPTSGVAVVTLASFPDPAALHALNPARYPHFLESVAHDTPRSRYDIVFAFPQSCLALCADGTVTRDGVRIRAASFLQALDATVLTGAEAPPDHDATPLPFRGGWFVYLGYELMREIEPRLAAMPVDAAQPLARLERFPAAVIRDHAAQRAFLVCEAGHAAQCLPAMQADVAALSALSPPDLPAASVQEEDPARFLDGVARCRDYIAAGDVYQVNLSRRWDVKLARACAPVALYARLRQSNPAPFAGFMSWEPGQAVISSSPERLVQVTGGEIVTRPIAGTYPRGASIEEDERLGRELLQHPKERAEHVMLIDLERNDLGRICVTGSVRVDEFMVRETYRHVHHIVSGVRGTLRTDVTPGQVIRAVFPGGTITGCPKLRCMEIIAELEQAPRGAYTGAMGYLNCDGSLDLNILIRTLVQDGANIQLRAGAGIVADSQPERELAETRAKARGLLAALGVA
jgi:anthranilate synthase component 1